MVCAPWGLGHTRTRMGSHATEPVSCTREKLTLFWPCLVLPGARLQSREESGSGCIRVCRECLVCVVRGVLGLLLAAEARRRGWGRACTGQEGGSDDVVLCVGVVMPCE